MYARRNGWRVRTVSVRRGGDVGLGVSGRKFRVVLGKPVVENLIDPAADTYKRSFGIVRRNLVVNRSVPERRPL